MIRTQIYLNDQQYHLAKLYAEQDGMPFSEIIRRGLDLALRERQKATGKKNKKKSFEELIGCINPGFNADAARDHNDIYDGKLSQELNE